MRIGIIRGDLPGPIFIGDVETISQHDPAIEPSGQTYYIGRPSMDEIAAALADPVTGAGAVLDGTDLTAAYPVTLVLGVSDVLKIRSGSVFEAFTIAAAVYANEAALLDAINAALAGSSYLARPSTTAGAIAIESKVKGVASRIENDSVAGGSTANVLLGLPDGALRTMPSAAEYITACLPVGGPLDVSAVAIDGTGIGTATTALALIPAARGTALAVANAIAPLLYDTPTVVTSFQTGMIAGFRSPSFNPDSRRPLPPGPAIVVVQDDGVTPFVAPLPNIVNAVIGGGNLTINGIGLGSHECKVTAVKIFGLVNKTVSQDLIEAEGGTVNPTAIVIPLASLPPGLGAATSSVQVRVETLASNVVILT